MNYNKLTKEELIRLANSFGPGNWEVVKSENNSEWNGHDVVNSDFIFQISYHGTIRIYSSNEITRYPLSINEEDKIREELQQIMSAYE